MVSDVDNQVSRHVCIGTPLELSTLPDTILYHVNTKLPHIGCGGGGGEI